MSLSHRKARKEIIFKDAQGNPLADRQVSIEQKSHSFLFGCGAFEFMNHIKDASEETADITEKWLRYGRGRVQNDGYGPGCKLQCAIQS